MKQLEQKTTEDIRTAGEPNNIHIVNPLGRIEEENKRTTRQIKTDNNNNGRFQMPPLGVGNQQPRVFIEDNQLTILI